MTSIKVAISINELTEENYPDWLQEVELVLTSQELWPLEKDPDSAAATKRGGQVVVPSPLWIYSCRTSPSSLGFVGDAAVGIKESGW
jgi:hypothetical protein